MDALYRSVESHSKITIKMADGVAWTSKTTEEGTTIEVAETTRPVESLAHELLHAELKVNGYRQYIAQYACLPTDRGALLQQVLSALDNELQHHRMFDRYVALGLDSKRFYNDSDKHAYKSARRDVQNLNAASPREYFLLPFLTVLGKGGMGLEKERVQLRNFILLKASQATKQALLDIEQTIAHWSASAEMDVGLTITQILRLLGGYEKTWIGRSDRFPVDGHFVGDVFTVDDMNEYFRYQA